MKNFEELILDENLESLHNTIRWNGKNFLKAENVAEHTHFVTWVTRILVQYIFPTTSEFDSIKLQIITYAMFHDLDENFTGDVNHTLKYNHFNGVKIREEIDAFIDFKIKDVFNLPNRHNDLIKKSLIEVEPLIKIIVKTADWISMCLYSRKEVMLGNRGFEDKLEYCIKSLNIHSDKTSNFLKNSKLLDTEIFNQIKNIQWIKQN